MIERIEEQVSLPMLLGLLASIGILSVVAAWLYMFKAPLNNYAALRSEQTVLAASDSPSNPDTQNINKIREEVSNLRNQLSGDDPQLTRNQMIPYVIGQLDLIAGRYAVQLVSVSPQTVSEVFMFDEIPFEIEIVGSYFDLYDWLGTVETELGPMAIKKFNIEPVTLDDSRRRMRMTLVYYRVRES